MDYATEYAARPVKILDDMENTSAGKAERTILRKEHGEDGQLGDSTNVTAPASVRLPFVPELFL